MGGAKDFVVITAAIVVAKMAWEILAIPARTSARLFKVLFNEEKEKRAKKDKS